MSLKIGTAAGLREAVEIHVGTAAGMKSVLEGWVGAADGRRQFYSATPTPPPPPTMSVSASPTELTWLAITPGSFYVSHVEATATAYGGTPPYSYAWSTDSGTAYPDHDAAATTLFYSGYGSSVTATCTVTDSLGVQAVSNPVSIS